MELQSAGAGPALAVVGVGLNVRMPQADQDVLKEAIERPWTDLASQMKNGSMGLSRNRLVALLLEELLDALACFESSGFEAFIPAWRELDLLQGRKILLEHSGQQIAGKAQGVDRNGGLLLETVSSGFQVFHSGEVSVHYG